MYEQIILYIVLSILSEIVVFRITRKIFQRKKNWINNNLINMIIERDKVYKFIFKTKDPKLKKKCIKNYQRYETKLIH